MSWNASNKRIAFECLRNAFPIPGPKVWLDRLPCSRITGGVVPAGQFRAPRDLVREGTASSHSDSIDSPSTSASPPRRPRQDSRAITPSRCSSSLMPVHQSCTASSHSSRFRTATLLGPGLRSLIQPDKIEGLAPSRRAPSRRATDARRVRRATCSGPEGSRCSVTSSRRKGTNARLCARLRSRSARREKFAGRWGQAFGP